MSTSRYTRILDGKYPGWDLWRTEDGRWIFRHRDIRQPDGTNTIEGSTIEDALNSACDYVQITVVPPRPTIYSVDLFIPYKSGSGWRLRYDSRSDMGVLVKTKKKALEVATMLANKSQEQMGKWFNEYGIVVENGVEGRDFVYGTG